VKKATFLAGLSLYYLPGTPKWVLTQRQAAGGKLQEVFAASNRRPLIAAALGVDDSISGVIAADSGTAVNPADHEIVAAWLSGDN
jgi:hypothetical protein